MSALPPNKLASHDLRYYGHGKRDRKVKKIPLSEVLHCHRWVLKNDDHAVFDIEDQLTIEPESTPLLLLLFFLFLVSCSCSCFFFSPHKYTNKHWCQAGNPGEPTRSESWSSIKSPFMLDLITQSRTWVNSVNIARAPMHLVVFPC